MIKNESSSSNSDGNAANNNNSDEILYDALLSADNVVERLCDSVGPLRVPVFYKCCVQTYDLEKREPLGGSSMIALPFTRFLHDDTTPVLLDFRAAPEDRPFFEKKNGVAFYVVLSVQVGRESAAEFQFASGLGDWNASKVDVLNHYDHTVWPVTLHFDGKRLSAVELTPNLKNHPRLRADLQRAISRMYQSRALSVFESLVSSSSSSSRKRKNEL